MSDGYDTGRQQIIDARRNVRVTGIPIAILLLGVLILLAGVYLEFSMWVMCLLLIAFVAPGFLSMHRKILEVSKIPCPRCEKPFGWSGSLKMISAADLACRNCNLELYVVTRECNKE